MVSIALPSVFHDLQLPLLYLNNIIALAIGPSHRLIQLGFSLPVLIVLVSQSFYKDWIGEWGIGYALKCLVCSVVFVYIDWILLASPDKERWHKIRHDESENNKDAVPQDFWQRLWWGLRLVTTNRYVGWSCQVKNVPLEVEGNYSRLRFVARKTLRSVFFYLLFDACKAYTAASPHGSWTDIAHIKPATGFIDRPFFYRLWFTWVHIILTYASLEHANAAYGVLSVATGMATPRDCPSTFGDLRDFVTVRKAWSTVWHQQCRRLCSTPGLFVTRNVLHLRKGSFASKYLQLFIGFAISAAVHGGASMLMSRSLDDDGAFKFFIGQALLIMVEDHLIKVGQKLGFKQSWAWRLCGLVWAVIAIGAGCQEWSSRTVEHGMWIHNRTPDHLGLGPKIIP